MRGIFRKKERRIIAAILGLAAIIIGIVAFTDFLHSKQFLQKAVSAENYLKAGSYEQAIEAYKQALSMKNGEEEQLTINLADAYIGINEYDKALEVLRAYYQKTSGLKVKEKIEEVTSLKTDFEYLQSISRAEIYFSNKEYNKAIEIFEEAKRIKSKDATAYQRIAKAYIELGKFDLAREEVLEGKEITKEESLNDILKQVDDYIRKDQYDTLLSQAAEYIYQENYEEGTAEYRKAILLLPEISRAYEELAKVYITKKEYNEAVLFLVDALEKADSDELQNLLEQATDLKKLEAEKNSLLFSLCSAMEKRKIGDITSIMDQKLFKDKIAREAPVYYKADGEDFKKGSMLIVYDNKNVYYGDVSDGIKKGSGIYLMLTKKKPKAGYYYYDGSWNNDLPNGSGETLEVVKLTATEGQGYISKTLTKGNFINAMEDGRMMKQFFKNDQETGKLLYLAKNGEPLALKEEGSQPVPSPSAGSYVIGEITLDKESTGNYYHVEPQTIWGVKPFIKDRNQ